MPSSRRVVAILVCGLCAPLLVSGAIVAGTYRSAEHFFSLTLPDDWTRLDAETFDTVKAATVDQGKQLGALEAIYQVEENAGGKLVVLTILYHEYPNESLAELAAAADKDIAEAGDKVKLALQTGHLSPDGMTEVDASYPTIIDAKRQLVRAEYVAEYNNRYRTHALTFYKPGREGVVHLGFQVLQEGYNVRLPVLESIVSSAVFAPGHEFQPGKQKTNLAAIKAKDQLDTLKSYGNFGLGCLGVVGLVVLVCAVLWWVNRWD